MSNSDYTARALGRIADEAIDEAKKKVLSIQSEWTANNALGNSRIYIYYNEAIVEIFKDALGRMALFAFDATGDHSIETASCLDSAADPFIAEMLKWMAKKAAAASAFGHQDAQLPSLETQLIAAKDAAIDNFAHGMGAVGPLKEFASSPPAAPTGEAKSGAASIDEIFIVHGRDAAAKSEVARFLERAGLKPVVLHEQANEGRTIMEKFEHHGGSASFAVVLLTPDDVGGPSADKLQPRARQNVVGEMFWFAGRLGRKRVCALKKGDIEIPSDFGGVGYTEMDDRGAWKAEVLRELKAAGYKIDFDKALG